MMAAITISMAIVFGALGDILFSKGMQSNGEVSIRSIADIPQVIRLVFTHPMILFGIASMAVYFGSYIAALSCIDVSIASPLTAMSYVLATFYALFGMKEHVSRARWIGVILITLGSVFIGMSS